MTRAAVRGRSGRRHGRSARRLARGTRGPAVNIIAQDNAPTHRMKGSGLYAQDVLPIPANMDVRGAGFGPGVAVKLDLAVVGAPYEDFNDLLAFLNHENAVC